MFNLIDASNVLHDLSTIYTSHDLYGISSKRKFVSSSVPHGNNFSFLPCNSVLYAWCTSPRKLPQNKKKREKKTDRARILTLISCAPQFSLFTLSSSSDNKQLKIKLKCRGTNKSCFLVTLGLLGELSCK